MKSNNVNDYPFSLVVNSEGSVSATAGGVRALAKLSATRRGALLQGMQAEVSRLARLIGVRTFPVMITVLHDGRVVVDDNAISALADLTDAQRQELARQLQAVVSEISAKIGAKPQK